MNKDSTAIGPDDLPSDPGRRFVVQAGAGFCLSFAWLATPNGALAFVSPRRQAGDAKAALDDGRALFAPNAFIRIDRNGPVRLVLPEVEMGQGAYTGQATLLAEELGISLDQVVLEHAPPNETLYGFEAQGGQVTGGSQTIHLCWPLLREAGAVARVMLVAAAAGKWGVPPGTCSVSNGRITHEASKRSVPFGEIAAAAALQPVPKNVALKGREAYTLIGRPTRRLDTPAKTNGSQNFGIDVSVPGMKYAAIVSAPRLAARVRSVKDGPVRSMSGIRDVVRLDDAVAVIADHFWVAKCGAAALEVEWEPGPLATISTATIAQSMATASKSGTSIVAKAEGAMVSHGARTVAATYRQPMLAHTTMEPMNATVSVTPTAAEIWAGTQVPARAAAVAAKLTGLPVASIKVHNQYIGGGFGRRLETDYIEQAVAIAKHVAYPVKVIWTREQDIAGDRFRPPYLDDLTATLGDDGRPTTWLHRVTSDSVLARWSPADMPKPDSLDTDCVDGAAEPPYDLPNRRIEWVRHNLPKELPIGWWRGVGPTHNLFVVESFVDELAHTAGIDPVEYRRALLRTNPRVLAVLNLAAEKFGWPRRPQSGRIGCGVAIGTPMGTPICAITEVEVSPQGDVKLRRATVAVDCGVAVNPEVIISQAQGGLIFGWSAALFSKITLRDGQVEQQNFNDYRVLRMNEAPLIDVHIVPSDEAPTGIGEPPTAISAPSLANAVFAACGVRIRELPIDRDALIGPGDPMKQVVT